MAERDIHASELPLDGAGARLRRAREAAGLDLKDVAARTKIAERHLAAIEEGRFADLASRTYAVGFSRNYARAVGLDEAEIVSAVHNELAAHDAANRPAKPAAFEPGDPARVPAAALAWAAALVGVAVIALVFVAWRNYFDPAVSLPDLTRDEATPAVAAARPAPARAAAKQPAPTGPVVFTALAPDVWVKFYDASGQQLMQEHMAQGESYTVPPDAHGPRIWTGRPDALRITIGGRPVAPLADRQTIVKDVPVSAEALLSREEPRPEAAAGDTVPPTSGADAGRLAAQSSRQPAGAPRYVAVAPTSPSDFATFAPRIAAPAVAARDDARRVDASTDSD